MIAVCFSIAVPTHRQRISVSRRHKPAEIILNNPLWRRMVVIVFSQAWSLVTEYLLLFDREL
jgi:hypothetical protein